MLHTRTYIALFGWLFTISGCNGPKSSKANTAPGLTFTQHFAANKLCLDDDGADAGQAHGCATNPWMQLQVVDGAVQDGSEIGLSGGDGLIIKGIPYGPDANTTEPVIGNFEWDDDSTNCFSGKLEHQTSDIWVELELTGGMHIPTITMTVEIEEHDEGHAVLTATTPLADTFSGGSDLICPQPEVEDTAGDTAVL